MSKLLVEIEVMMPKKVPDPNGTVICKLFSQKQLAILFFPNI